MLERTRRGTLPSVMAASVSHAHEQGRARLVRKRAAALAAAALFALGCAGGRPTPGSASSCAIPVPDDGATVIDLSHAYDEHTIFWPTEEEFSLEKEYDGVTPGGYYYAANRFRTAEHGGTHVDAPIHFAHGGSTVDRLPLERLIGPAIVVSVVEACARDRDYRVTVADLEAWERAHGAIPRGAIVLLSTGFARFWPDRERYMGTNERGPEAVKKLHFPGLHPDAARWLVDARAIRAVGLDTPSIDHGPSTTFETHRVLLGREVPVFENLTNLDRLPPTGATVVALPMKIRGGSGAPLRAVALVPKLAD
jgi:kynurenine formamidase